MAETNDLVTIAMKAGADLSAAQYHVVRISDGVDQVNIASLDNHSSMIGVLLNKPAAVNRMASVAQSGKGKVVAGAAVSSAGIFLTCNGSGRAVAVASGDMTFGRSLETAGADGDVISVMLMTPFKIGPVP